MLQFWIFFLSQLYLHLYHRLHWLFVLLCFQTLFIIALWPSVCPSVCLFVCLYFSQSLCLSLSLSFSLSLWLSVCLSVCLTVGLFVCLSVCLLISFFTFECFDTIDSGHPANNFPGNGDDLIPLGQVPPGALRLCRGAVRSAALDEQTLDDLGGFCAALESEAEAEFVARKSVDDQILFDGTHGSWGPFLKFN